MGKFRNDLNTSVVYEQRRTLKVKRWAKKYDRVCNFMTTIIISSAGKWAS